MLPKKIRLHKSHEIIRIVHRGRFLRNAHFVIKYNRGAMGVSRIAFIVSNKISKKATIRNRIRRQLRSIFFLLQKGFKEKYDMVIIVRPPIIKATYQEMKNEIEALLRYGRII